jgi:hypothetical protein
MKSNQRLEVKADTEWISLVGRFAPDLIQKRFG